MTSLTAPPALEDSSVPTGPAVPPASLPHRLTDWVDASFGWGALAVAGSFLALWTAWRLLVWNGGQGAITVDALFRLPPGLAAAMLGWRVAGHPKVDAHVRRAWAFLALSALLTWLATSAWSAYEIVGHLSRTPLWVDFFTLASYPATMYGLLSFPAAPRARERRVKFWLDVATVLLGGAMLSWFTVLRPTAVHSDASQIADVLALLYPALDLVLVIVVAVVLARETERRSRATLELLATGQLVGIVADITYGHLRLSGGYRSGSWIDLLWLASTTLLALAAWAQWRGAGTDGSTAVQRGSRPPERLRSRFLPYVSIAVAFYVLLFVAHPTPGTALSEVIYSTIVMTALVVARQITASQEAARLAMERAAQDERFRSLVQNSSDVVVILDDALAITYVSPSVRRLLGVPADALTGRPFESLVAPAEATLARDYLNRAVAGSPAAARVRTLGSTRLRVAHRDGSGRHVEIAGSDLRADATVGGLVLNLRDITERVQLEEQLRQSQKMEVVGRLAGGVAHDFNNLLMAVSGNVELLLAEVPFDAPHRESVLEIRAAAERASALTKQLLAFSRRQLVQPTVLDPNGVAANLERIIRRLIGSHIEVRLELDPAAGRIRADAGQLEQVLMNLAVNARDAMPESGTLTIRTSHVTLGEMLVHDGGIVPAGSYVLLTVADTGQGMGAETLARMFEPFFTTKAPGAGTGLGLSTVHGIVTEAGGTVAVRSAPGAGTTFDIYFPRVDEGGAHAPGALPAVESAPVARANVQLPAPPLAREPEPASVLVVDDELALRMVVRRILEKHGYRVLAAEDGVRALEVVQGDGVHIDLVLTDIVMPNMGGVELARELADRRPDLRVMFMTGFAEQDVLKGRARDVIQPLIRKPFEVETLVAAVRQALEGAPQAPSAMVA